MNLNPQKFKALIHYICFRCEPHELGSTKLNKALWYADLNAYLLFGEPISGETYIKRQYGPVSRHILDYLSMLEQEGVLVARENPHFFGYNKKEYIARYRPDLSMFTPDEVCLIDEVIDATCRKNTAASVSEHSHDEIWEAAEIGEEIPYYAVFTKFRDEIGPEDIEWARRSVAEG